MIISNKQQPLVTVLMSVYNAENFLSLAIESILNQTYKNFEFLIIDDGSSDKTLEIIKSYNDDRIKLVVNEENKGLAFSLNLGMKLARGKYVARMDADDISHPKRLAKQVKYLEKHSDISILGTWAQLIDEKGKHIRFYILPLRNEIIMAKMVFHIGIVHPSILIRKSDFERLELNYDPQIKLPLEDKELWIRAGGLLKFGNLPSFLIKYRVLPSSVSRVKKKMDDKFHFVVNLLKDYLHAKFNMADLDIIAKFIGGAGCWGTVKPTCEDYKDVIQIISKNKLNKYEKSYLCFILLQISRIDKKYTTCIGYKERFSIYYNSLKWIIYQF